MEKFCFTTIAALLVLAFSVSSLSQTGPTAEKQPAYSYAAQKAFLPADLGQVYLGMSFKDFASKIDISKAEANDRFDYLHLDIPFEKGSVKSLSVRVHGLSTEQTKAMLTEGSVTKKSWDGTEYQESVKRPKVESIPGGIVYSMYVEFKSDFDLRAWAEKAYGKGEVRAKDDPHHFYDQQWVKRTSDGLGWMIRAFYNGESRTLQLLGRVPGSEWDPE